MTRLNTRMAANTQELRNYFVVVQLRRLNLVIGNITLFHCKSSG